LIFKTVAGGVVVHADQIANLKRRRRAIELEHAVGGDADVRGVAAPAALHRHAEKLRLERFLGRGQAAAVTHV
jgi:hypothetical protein